ncbi:MAG: hypothetical protein IK999_01520 [Ruminococcus sp.]|nr:hypothetical protein [Ruminococcus sp.]
MKTLKVISLTMFLVVEIILAIVMIGATVAPVGDSEPLGELPIMAAISGLFALEGIVGFGGLYRITQKRRLPYLTAWMMKISVGLAIIGLFVLQFELDDKSLDGVPLLFWAAAAVSLLITVIVCKKIRKGDTSYQTDVQQKVTSFVGTNAQMNYDAAAKEYFGGAVPEYISDIDNIRLWEYAAMPIALWLGWLIRHGLESDIFRQKFPGGDIDAVRGGMVSPVELLGRNNYALMPEDISEEGSKFNWYFNERTYQVYTPYIHSFQFDYYDIYCENGKYYCNGYDAAKAEKLYKVIDKEYECISLRGAMSCEDRKCESVWSDYFGCELDVYTDSQTDDSYVKACTDEVSHPSGELARAIRREMQMYADLYNERNAAYRTDAVTANTELFKPECIMVPYPFDGRLAYSVSGSFAPDDMGFEFSVLDGVVLGISAEYDAPDPWSEDSMQMWAIYKSDLSKMRRVLRTPKFMGGEDIEENTISLPTVLADFKEKCDRRIECMIKQGLLMDYEFVPEYNGEYGKISGIRVNAKANVDWISAFSGELKIPVGRM